MIVYTIKQTDKMRNDLYKQICRFDFFKEPDMLHPVQQHHLLGRYLPLEIVDILLKARANIQDAVIYIGIDKIGIVSSYDRFKMNIAFDEQNGMPMGKSVEHVDDVGSVEEKYIDKPHGWMKIYGADICMDIHCECGELSHIDGEFIEYVQCPECGNVYALNGHIEFIRVLNTDGLNIHRAA